MNAVQEIPKKILIIQTAFLGDVILATALVEKLHAHFPESKIDFLLRRGNEGALANNPKIRRVIIWNKGSRKYTDVIRLLFLIRREKYDLVVNVQRFFISGLLAGFSSAKRIVGFDKNPVSFLFTKKIPHSFEGHEVGRDLKLIEDITNDEWVRPVIYTSATDESKVLMFQSKPYYSIAPASIWFTKQFPKEKWVEFLRSITAPATFYLLGSKSDASLCEEIIASAGNPMLTLQNFAGKFSITETAAVMKKAVMNFVNDSAPLHIASAVNAPVNAIFCSTVPQFGFGPLSDCSFITEIKEKLYCRPCGIHGKTACPEGHFRCAKEIEVSDLMQRIK